MYRGKVMIGDHWSNQGGSKTGGALLEFSMRTAVHGTSCVLCPISIWSLEGFNVFFRVQPGLGPQCPK